MRLSLAIIPEISEEAVMSRALTIWTAALGVLLSPAFAAAQGILVHIQPDDRVPLPRPIIIVPPHPHPRPVPRPTPVPQSTYKIKTLEVNAKLADQVAKVQVSQSFVNTGSRQMEVAFVFPLPYDGAIDQLTLLVDGKEFPAKLLDAKEARQQYEAIVRKNQDPALLEWMGTGMFKTSVFPVPPGAERKVTLRFSQLCRKLDGLTDFLFPLSTAKYTSHPVEEVKISLALESQSDIKNVYSPTHTVEIKRPDDKHANITYTAKNEVPTSDFRLLYDVGKGQVGTSVISFRPKSDEEGYLLLLTSPEIKAANDERPKKTVLFVLDRSGSMSGEKIDQAKNALKFVLNNLREGDTFNIIAYDSEVETWKPELQKFNDETRKAAAGFVEGLYAGGSTNIHGALTKALEQLKDKSRPNFVIFLTDGLPTVGETNEQKIAAAAKQKNDVRARLFVFGVGYDLNARLLDKLARENFGLTEYVRPSENIEAHVSALYNRIGAPVMSDVKIKFDVEGAKTEEGEIVTRQYPKEVTDLFAGEQLVIVARYKKPGDAKVVITGKVGDKEQKLDFPAKLVEKSSDESQAFVEKLWAMRRIGEILDEIDLKGKNDELTKELVTLSTKHGLLTPYTSFLADENAPHNLAQNLSLTRERLDSLSEVSGDRGVSLRINKDFYRRATAAGEAKAAEAAFEGLYDRDAIVQSAPADATPQPAGTAAGGYGASDARIAGRAYSVRGGAIPLSSSANGAGGYGGARKSAAAATAMTDRELAERAKVAENVRRVGNKSFFRRGERWVDSAVDALADSNDAKKTEKPKQIKRFSDEYFELVDKHGKDVAKYLAFDEPVTLVLDGQVYEFVD
jgi:Ca-activated chloride channel family protein